MIRGIREHKAINAMAHTLNDSANMTNNVTLACESTLNAHRHADRLAYGSMSLAQAYELMSLLTHGLPCETVAPTSQRKPISRLALVKVLRLVFELGYQHGRASK